jgi:hypothetical protein
LRQRLAATSKTELIAYKGNPNNVGGFHAAGSVIQLLIELPEHVDEVLSELVREPWTADELFVLVSVVHDLQRSPALRLQAENASNSIVVQGLLQRLHSLAPSVESELLLRKMLVKLNVLPRSALSGVDAVGLP